MDQIHSIPLDQITTLPQVRTKFNNANLLELGEDIKKRGLLQPIVVTPEGNGYRLIIGERRLRAMKLAGCELAPAIIAPAQTGGDLMETQLIENIQREDLNNKDLIDGVKALFDKYGKSVKAVAGILNKSNTWVSKKVAIALQAGPLTMRLIEAEIKDGELLYAFAKLETIDTAVALDLVDGIVGRTVGRKDVQAALKAAAAGGVETEEERDDTTGDLFPEEAKPAIDSDAAKLQKKLDIALMKLGIANTALKKIAKDINNGTTVEERITLRKEIAQKALDDISQAK